MSHNGRTPIGVYTVGIAALFLAGFLALVLFGARCYADAAEGQTENNDCRALLSYLTARVKAGDAAGGVSIGAGVDADSPALIIRDGQSGYVTRIYLYDGALVEDYGREDAALDPAAAQTIGQTEMFTVETNGALLRLGTDAGTALVYLRSEGGVAA